MDGRIDKCTGAYKSGVVTGAAATLVTNAVGAIPKTLTHLTTEAGAAGIAQSGIKSSSAGLFGTGKYASSVGDIQGILLCHVVLPYRWILIKRPVM